MLSLRQVEKSKIEPWGSGPEAAIQQAGSVPWRTQSSPARCELRASQNKPVTVTGGGYVPLGCHIQSLFVEVTSSVLQQRSPSTVHSLQGPHHNRSAGRQRDMKSAVPVTAWFNFTPHRIQTNPAFPLLNILGENITEYIWEGDSLKNKNLDLLER